MISAHRPSSAFKRPKANSRVDEITAFNDGPISEDDCGSETGGAIAVQHARRGPSCISAGATNAVLIWEDEVKRLIAAGRHEEAVRLVAPSDGLIRCTVRRVKNFLGNTLAYHVYLDSGDTFLLAARKRKKSKASNFILSTSQEELSRESTHCIAKLRANFVGTEYALVGRVGSGCSASDDEDGGISGGGAGRLAPRPEPFSREDLAVHYKQTALKAKAGPRVMLVATPLPESSWCPSAADGSDSLPSCLELARRRELSPRLERQLCMLATRPPEWDPALKAYTLDFHGRVRAASIKNFQLVHWDHNTDRRGADLVLQYGKVDEGSDDFALDFTYPLTIQKAFAIALASTDSKLCTAL
ncbi:hypothetical protein GPECTOR_4g918 [Gonium pectorale]|uniref:Tubby C-terminal domain-containing protein n=1 Tax=Gonium pectorale TaxID=33097 RepID=A0A150GY55_GONPE|nr:hypothetical protein GPECTOR_4g918 [Gonium pectorale]|eukprot:KXZ54846.1 hypothetical protein GPECTOR_4g918 [Gonium pectorale]